MDRRSHYLLNQERRCGEITLEILFFFVAMFLQQRDLGLCTPLNPHDVHRTKVLGPHAAYVTDRISLCLRVLAQAAFLQSAWVLSS